MTLILGIESSCDETACAVVRDGREILSSIVSSQINVHTLYGGVVPEVASRIHVENISAVISEALRESGVSMQEIDAVAYTQGPGLIGSLHVGVQAAKTLAFIYGKPLVPVQHLTGHIYANSFVGELKFPLLALVISGGHTELVWMKNDWDYEVIGETCDDAIGEAYDKAARVLGLGYPGGPVMDRMGRQGKEHYHLPTPKTARPYDFSFSGLKTAVLQLVQREEKAGREIIKEDVAYAFQETALGSLVDKTCAAVKEYRPAMLVLAGGVAANSRLREMITERMKEIPDTELIIPPLKYCTDNAAMIGAAGYAAWRHQAFGTWTDSADPGLEMPHNS
ncbi:MAG: tRNA (adenosine(37)-N6)-threonylcarbamoyltransferase complex transferase subunit TsaD [Solobacterium sp.]|nr:tRNA (adenosine(37)-N6)-threonylcarbamoyltransferase complex transferase subunit TsaD [Solobacterium sp.]MBR0479221.1 tRNA (adenosine(37)-N6)-threonylcarbamoyltransferase complex transferase subunit TsaD [Solobacterium sp.]MBR2726373.1 tRNA (adenosine(37)-N6)-threonylcarbamoyltransferase complex transferase subunit TsaD [Solobacterium sp.]